MEFEDIEKTLDRTAEFTNEDFESLGLPDDKTIEKNILITRRMRMS